MPVEPVEVAVIGTGWCGGIRAETLSRYPLVKKLHVCEIRPDRLKEVQALTGAAVATLDYQDIVKNDAVKVVYISTTPESTHFPIARDCLRAGKNVLLEKPIALELYEADELQRPQDAGVRRQVRATREVILAGGAFNTPQLLQLSGIGPADLLRRHKIPVRVDLPGVGANLQDRYEASVVLRMKKDFSSFQGATLVAVVRDILDALSPAGPLGLRWPQPAGATDAGAAPPSEDPGAAAMPPPGLSAEHGAVLRALSADPVSVEALAVAGGLPVAGALAALQTLELFGVVERLPDGSYIRCS